LAEQVEAYLKQQDTFSRLVQVPQITRAGTAMPFALAEDLCKSDSVLVLNGDDLFGARDLAKLAQFKAGLIVHAVDEAAPIRHRLSEAGRHAGAVGREGRPWMAASSPTPGAYVFLAPCWKRNWSYRPAGNMKSPTTSRDWQPAPPFHVVESTFWLPSARKRFGKQAQEMDLDKVMTRASAKG